jgi:hypothetical protein
LEPSSIGGPELQVVSVTTVLNVEGLVFEHLVPDCLGSLIEPPDLRVILV